MCVLTPSDKAIHPKPYLVDGECPYDHSVQVQSFYQHPEEVGHLEVVKHHDHHLTRPLGKEDIV